MKKKEEEKKKEEVTARVEHLHYFHSLLYAHRSLKLFLKSFPQLFYADRAVVIPVERFEHG